MLQHDTMSQTVTQEPPQCKASVYAKGSPYGSSGRQSGTATGVFEYLGFPLPISFYQCYIASGSVTELRQRKYLYCSSNICLERFNDRYN
jgi:hypothetical protein